MDCHVQKNIYWSLQVRAAMAAHHGSWRSSTGGATGDFNSEHARQVPLVGAAASKIRNQRTPVSNNKKIGSTMSFLSLFVWTLLQLDLSILFRQLMPDCTEVFRSEFWMKHYNHGTPKRSCLWSTAWPIFFFNKGKLCRRKAQKSYDTTVRYIDSKGRARFKGSKDLKRTQILCSNFSAFSGVICF